uniref:Uncharacterized protein n=1 Tax=Anguilla anguilla TaxID=7936 RepID=A0A0E9T1Z5_ANGAN
MSLRACLRGLFLAWALSVQRAHM